MAFILLPYVSIYAGFEPLDISEVNDDYGVIDNFAGFIVDTDDMDVSTQDLEANKMIMRSIRPPHPPELNVLRKRRRYIAWTQEPERIQEEMLSYHNAVQYIHKELRTLERQESRWLNSFEFSRNYLIGCLDSCINENKRMAIDGKHLTNLCAEEIGRLESNRKKKNAFSRDVMIEMNDRQENVETLLEQYEGVLEDLTPRIQDKAMPVAHIEIDEKTGKRWNGQAATDHKGNSAQNSTSGVERGGEPVLRRSLRSADTAVEQVEIDPSIKLEEMLRPFDDSGIFDTKHCSEIDAFYNSENPQWVFPKNSSQNDLEPLTEENKKWHVVPEGTTEKLLAKPYFNLNKHEASWYKLVENLCNGASVSDALSRASEEHETESKD